jgi:hypothetical protein
LSGLSRLGPATLHNIKVHNHTLGQRGVPLLRGSLAKLRSSNLEEDEAPNALNPSLILAKAQEGCKSWSFGAVGTDQVMYLVLARTLEQAYPAVR